MEAEIISVGDELSSGQRLDTNSQWLSQKLGDIGIAVSRHTTIADNLPANIELMREAARRSEIVVITGGLGPTLDDLTREAMAAAFDLPLELDEPSLQHIENLFARRGRPMPERNRVQAQFPRGTNVIPNSHGSAPGIDLAVSTLGHACRFFALPGVPAEMKQMWSEVVQPRIESMQGLDRGTMYFRSVKLFGLGESDVEARVPTLIARDRYPKVGITVSQATITLRIAARAKSEPEFEQTIAPTLAEIQSQLGDIIFGYEEDEIQDALADLLWQRKLQLACAEVGGSWICPMMHDATSTREWQSVGRTTSSLLQRPGSESKNQLHSCEFVGGIAFQGVEAAGYWLAESSLDSGALQDPSKLALALAEKVRSEMSASIGLAVVGYPAWARIANQSAGTTFPFGIAFSGPGVIEEFCEQRDLGGHPEVLNPRVAKTAMDLLRRAILQQFPG